MPPHEPVSTMPPGSHAFAPAKREFPLVEKKLGKDRAALGIEIPVVEVVVETAIEEEEDAGS